MRYTNRCLPLPLLIVKILPTCYRRTAQNDVKVKYDKDQRSESSIVVHSNYEHFTGIFVF